MTQSELEKRMRARRTAYLYVSLYLKSNHHFFGLLADLSKTGFKMTSESEIESDKEFELAIKNPHMAPANTLNFFSAKAMWSTPQENGIYETGFQFVERSTESAALFRRLEGDFEATAKAIYELDVDSPAPQSA